MAQLAEILGSNPTISKILSILFISVIEKTKKEALNGMARFFKRQNKLGCFDAES